MKSIVTAAAATGMSLLFLTSGVAFARHGQDDQSSATATAPQSQDDGATKSEGGDANDDHGSAAAGDTKSGGTAADDHGGHGAAPAGHGPKATEVFNLRGTVASVDVTAGTVTMRITKSNHGGRGGRSLAGRTITVATTGARLDLSDVNGDGTVDLGDVSVGDRVEVRVLLPRPLTALPSTPVNAQRFRDDDAR